MKHSHNQNIQSKILRLFFGTYYLEIAILPRRVTDIW